MFYSVLLGNYGLVLQTGRSDSFLFFQTQNREVGKIFSFGLVFHEVCHSLKVKWDIKITAIYP